MIQGGEAMRLLKIEDKQGLFLSKGGEYVTVDKMTKESLLYLVDLSLEHGSGCELDEYDQENLPNQAHQIIYKNVYEKISQLTARKDEFLDRSERLYLDEYERYKSDGPQQGAESDTQAGAD